MLVSLFDRSSFAAKVMLMILMLVQGSGSTSCMSGRSRCLVGFCTMVSFRNLDTTVLRLADIRMFSTSAPFLVMGRVTYVHHYVRLYLLLRFSCSRHQSDFPSSSLALQLAPDTLLLRPHARPPDRPLRVLLSPTERTNEMDRLWSLHQLDRVLVLVVQGRGVRD